jgi:hypothetical protein
LLLFSLVVVRMMEDKEKEDLEFQAVEARLQAEREAHARRIAAENTKKRRQVMISQVQTKRPPTFVSSAAPKGGYRTSFHGRAWCGI